MLPTSFIERPNKTAVYFLLSRLNNEFWASHYMKDEDHSKKQSITLTKTYLEECKKNNCIVRANYKPSKLDIHNNLRLYGDGIQNIPSRFRGLLYLVKIRQILTLLIVIQVFYAVCVKLMILNVLN